ncbi:MAG: thymidylate synthase [Prochlorothrix sp.]
MAIGDRSRRSPKLIEMLQGDYPEHRHPIAFTDHLHRSCLHPIACTDRALPAHAPPLPMSTLPPPTVSTPSPESPSPESPSPIAPYVPHYKPNQVLRGQGAVVVVTGWTVRQSLAKVLNPEEYAAIGQLYSPTRGISLLLRNLLANPHIRDLVILSATKEDRNAGGCERLRDFFDQGFQAGQSDTGADCWVIGAAPGSASGAIGYIDSDLPDTALNQVRQAVRYHFTTDLQGAIAAVRACNQRLATEGQAAPWAKPQFFPLKDTKPTVFPGPRYGHRIEGKTIAETWVRLIHRIKTTGTIRPTGYDGYWQELINLVAVVTAEPEDFYFPEPNYLPCDRPFIQEYISQILDDAPYREGVKYTYGQRLRSWFGRDQIEQVIAKLMGEIDAASAVMSLWDVKDHEKGGSPCLNHIWLRVVDQELSLTAVFRSNDMFSAWPANAMGLRALQQHIRDRIAADSDYDLRLGPLMTVSQSAHIYDDTWDNADRLIATQYAQLYKTQDFSDPAGNFLIELEVTDAGAEIVVTHTTSGSGEAVQTYRGKNPLRLLRQICQASPMLRPEHSGYLGMELQKAAIALKTGKIYHQDREICF